MSQEQDLLKKVQELNAAKKYEQVINLLPNALLEQYKNADLYAEKAECYWRIEQVEECKKMAEAALELDDLNSKGHNYLGNVYSELKEYEKAIEQYKKAINIDLNFRDPYINLGNVYSDLKEYEKAIEQYKKAIEIDPKYPGSYNNLGLVYYDLKDCEKAIAQYTKAIETDPKYASAYNNLGIVHKELERDLEAAIEQFTKAIEIDPKYAISYFNLGLVYHELKDYEKAIAQYTKAININPNFIAPYNNLGHVFMFKNQYKEAKIEFLKVLELSQSKNDFLYINVQSKIEEIDKILSNISNYKGISDCIKEIKSLLLFKEEFITHYTSLSTAQNLLLNNSPMRLSEGSFLNDTSEGQDLFEFLELENTSQNKLNQEIFSKKPFIGSFVDATKNNDLTLWRMYGKEALEEAKGCSISINANTFKEGIMNTLIPKNQENTNNLISDKNESNLVFDEIKFYRVAYRNCDKFVFAGASEDDIKELDASMKKLQKEIKLFKEETKTITEQNESDKLEIITLINQVAFLFKSIEYQYENEIRLVIKQDIGFTKKIDFDADKFSISPIPFKVYIELVPIVPYVSSLVIGPKVSKAEEWAATFYYQLSNNKHKPQISVSKLPFK